MQGREFIKVNAALAASLALPKAIFSQTEILINQPIQAVFLQIKAKNIGGSQESCVIK